MVILRASGSSCWSWEVVIVSTLQGHIQIKAMIGKILSPKSASVVLAKHYDCNLGVKGGECFKKSCVKARGRHC